MKISEFLQRINDDYATQKTQYKIDHHEHFEFLSKYLETMARQNQSRPEAIIQDVLGMLHFKHRDDLALCEYLKDAIKLADNDQHPKVSIVKDNILNHLRASETPCNLKPGIEFAINQIDAYKGNQFDFMLRDLKDQLVEAQATEPEQVDFVHGAVQVIDFFSKHYRNPVLGRGEESSLSI